MKKKKVSLLLFFLLFLGIVGSYYAEPILSRTERTEFQFKAEEGDLEELARLHYVGNIGISGKMNVDVSLERTQLIESGSVQSAYTEGNPQIKEWQKKYPSFMRKKNGFYQTNFAENEQYLFYIGDYLADWKGNYPQAVQLPIERLDKTAKTVEKKQLTIDSPEPIYQVSLNKIEISEPFLAVNVYIGSTETPRSTTYIYNWETGEVTDQIQEEESEAEEPGFGSYSEIESLQTEMPSFLLTRSEYSYDPDAEDGTGEEEFRTSYQLYNPAARTAHNLSIPEKIAGARENHSIEKGKITFVKLEEDHFQVVVFDPEKDEVLQEKNISLHPHTFSEDPYLKIMSFQNRLLITAMFAEKASDGLGFVILDAETLEKRLEGKLMVSEDLNQLVKNEMFSFEDIYYQEDS